MQVREVYGWMIVLDLSLYVLCAVCHDLDARRGLNAPCTLLLRYCFF
jgi:hypothetical protein